MFHLLNISFYLNVFIVFCLITTTHFIVYSILLLGTFYSIVVVVYCRQNFIVSYFLFFIVFVLNVPAANRLRLCACYVIFENQHVLLIRFCVMNRMNWNLFNLLQRKFNFFMKNIILTPRSSESNTKRS